VGLVGRKENKIKIGYQKWNGCPKHGWNVHGSEYSIF
jgi:hypothetical protein